MTEDTPVCWCGNEAFILHDIFLKIHVIQCAKNHYVQMIFDDADYQQNKAIAEWNAEMNRKKRMI